MSKANKLQVARTRRAACFYLVPFSYFPLTTLQLPFYFPATSLLHASYFPRIFLMPSSFFPLTSLPLPSLFCPLCLHFFLSLLLHFWRPLLSHLLAVLMGPTSSKFALNRLKTCILHAHTQVHTRVCAANERVLKPTKAGTEQRSRQTIRFISSKNRSES